MKRLVVAACLLMFAAVVNAQEQPSATLSVSPTPAILGTSAKLMAQTANLGSLEGVSVRFERLQDPDSGRPVAAGTPGAVWAQQGADSSLNSRMSAELSVDTTSFGIGTWPVRVRITSADDTEMIATASLTVAGQ